MYYSCCAFQFTPKMRNPRTRAVVRAAADRSPPYASSRLSARRRLPSPLSRTTLYSFSLSPHTSTPAGCGGGIVSTGSIPDLHLKHLMRANGISLFPPFECSSKQARRLRNQLKLFSERPTMEAILRQGRHECAFMSSSKPSQVHAKKSV